MIFTAVLLVYVFVLTWIWFCRCGFHMLFDYISQKGCMGQKPQQQNNTTSTATQHGLEKDYGSKVEKHKAHLVL